MLHNRRSDLAAVAGGPSVGLNQGTKGGGTDAGGELSLEGIPLTELTDAVAAIWPDLRPFSILSKLNSRS